MPPRTCLSVEFAVAYPVALEVWRFEYEYPGFFVFWSPATNIRIYFTPDWGTTGAVALDVMDGVKWTTIEADDLAFDAATGTPEQLFALVFPYLVRFHP